jgi:RND family efflux transporter MFP subunit
VHMGQEVHLVLDAYPGRIFSGRITSILPYLDPATRTNAVEVTLANPADGTGERMLKPGMFGKAEIVVARHENAVVAPGVALLMDDLLLDSRKPGQILRRAFAVGEDGKASERVVEIGIRQGSAYEILSGLEEGEKLVVRGQHGLVDGQAVRVVEAEK